MGTEANKQEPQVITKGNCMDRIMLNDLLRFDDEQIESARIKFNLNNSYFDAVERYRSDPERFNNRNLLWHINRRYFQVGQIAICFVRLAKDIWLMTGIKRITKLIDPGESGIGYKAEDVEEYLKYCGRLKLRFHNTSRSVVKRYDSVMDEIEVLEILNDTYTAEDFPGYDNVRISYKQLKQIVERKPQSWVTALANQKAVYLITDAKKGKFYVGSATSDNGMLFNRWSQYAENGHGGNVEFKKLIKEKGLKYIENNFEYSILENYNAKIQDEDILRRENWWKETLHTRTFGYNDN